MLDGVHVISSLGLGHTFCPFGIPSSAALSHPARGGFKWTSDGSAGFSRSYVLCLTSPTPEFRPSSQKRRCDEAWMRMFPRIFYTFQILVSSLWENIDFLGSLWFQQVLPWTFERYFETNHYILDINKTIVDLWLNDSWPTEVGWITQTGSFWQISHFQAVVCLENLKMIYILLFMWCSSLMLSIIFNNSNELLTIIFCYYIYYY
jgi:hypothetical protein